MCQPMTTTSSSLSSSCPTIKANASLRRSRPQWRKDGQQYHQDCPPPPTKDAAGGRRRANNNRRRQQQQPCDSSSASTASTEQLSISSYGDGGGGGSLSSSSSSSFEVSSPTATSSSSSKRHHHQRRRRTNKNIAAGGGDRRPRTMVVNVPLRRSPSSSSSSVDDIIIDNVDDDIEMMKSRYLALDCEMVGIGPNGSTSRLARVSVVNWHSEVIYDAHVRVEECVTDYRTFVSGIYPEDLLESSGAISFDVVRNDVLDLIRGKVLIGHGLRNDFAALGIHDHPWHDVRDTARYEPFMRRLRPNEYNPTPYDNATHVPKKLRILAKDKLRMEIQVDGIPHCPIEDAVAAMGLYKRHRVKWERAIRYKVERTREICGAIGCGGGK